MNYTRYESSIEAAAYESCLAAAAKDGFSPDEAEQCEEGALGCSTCPFSVSMKHEEDMMTVSKKKLREAMTIMATVVNADRMVTKKDGTFEFRFGFYYHCGRTAQSMAQKVAHNLPHIKVVNARERWAPWPKSSYWSVVVEVTDAEGLVAAAQALTEEWGAEWKDLVADIKAGHSRV